MNNGWQSEKIGEEEIDLVLDVNQDSEQTKVAIKVSPDGLELFGLRLRNNDNEDLFHTTKDGHESCEWLEFECEEG